MDKLKSYSGFGIHQTFQMILKVASQTEASLCNWTKHQTNVSLIPMDFNVEIKFINLQERKQLETKMKLN